MPSKLRRVFRLVPVVVLSILLAIPTPAHAVFESIETGRIFKNKNGVIYFKKCDTQSSNSVKKPVKSVDTGDGGGCGGTTEENKDQIWSYLNNQFRAAGYSPEEAEMASAGVMGNWQAESGFSPNRHNEPNPGTGCVNQQGVIVPGGLPELGPSGLGMAQWCGSRQVDLKNFADERGTDISCLGTQLEFVWHEMETRNPELISQMKGQDARGSADVFDRVFEGSVGSGEREEKAAAIYDEYKGNAPEKLVGDNRQSGGAGEEDNCESSSVKDSKNTGGGNGGVTNSADCAAAQKRVEELHASGKITYEKEDALENDVSKCTSEQIERCAEGTTSVEGGSRPSTLNGIANIAENSGVESIQLWNINTAHGCDQHDHPVGLATDIKQCDGQDAVGGSEACQKVVDYLIANKDELNISYIIWDNYKCGEIMCDSDHNDHIHVSFKE